MCLSQSFFFFGQELNSRSRTVIKLLQLSTYEQSCFIFHALIILYILEILVLILSNSSQCLILPDYFLYCLICF